MGQEIFQNTQVEMASLPTVSELTWIPLQASYRQMLLFLAILQFAVLVTLVTLVVPLAGLPVWLALTGYGFAICIAGIEVLVIMKSFPYKGYVLRTHDVLYRTGWLFKRQTAIPLSRIQHVEVRQGLFERAYGLYKINIYTAGGESSDITIPGLREDAAQRLKEFILQEMIARDAEQ